MAKQTYHLERMSDTSFNFLDFKLSDNSTVELLKCVTGYLLDSVGQLAC